MQRVGGAQRVGVEMGMTRRLDHVRVGVAVLRWWRRPGVCNACAGVRWSLVRHSRWFSSDVCCVRQGRTYCWMRYKAVYDKCGLQEMPHQMRGFTLLYHNQMAARAVSVSELAAA